MFIIFHIFETFHLLEKIICINICIHCNIYTDTIRFSALYLHLDIRNIDTVQTFH